jgi:hypothetical protein
MILKVACIIAFMLQFVSAWHQTIEFDFRANLKSSVKKSSDLRWFESEYASRDNFALLSHLKNNLFATEATNMSLNQRPSIFIGARNHLFELSMPDLMIIKVCLS